MEEIMTDRPLLGERADLRRIVESVLNIPSAGHASAEELATTILDALSDVLTPAAAVLNWENGEARSPLGDLYRVEGLSTNVWVTYWNGTALSGWRMSIERAKAEAQADYIRRSAFASFAAQEKQEAGETASIVPQHCSGTSLGFDPGTLHVNKDGSGYIAISEYEFALEDDRCEGENGPEGSTHWIVRLDASEITALRNFLNGVSPLVATQAQVPAIPDGWKLVPVEPTSFMIASAISVDWRRGEDVVRLIWKKMLSDAPSPDLPEGEVWKSMDSAPTDGSEFVAFKRYPGGRSDCRVYRWVSEPCYWVDDRRETCIRHSYQDDYRWAPSPSPIDKGEVK